MPVLTDLKDETSDKINEDDSKLLIDISFQDKVQLIYPQYTLKENIILNLADGINQDDFITFEEDVSVSYELNEENNSIIIH